MNNVALINCKSYEKEECLNALNELINALGGLEKFVKPKQKVLVKPNLLNNFKVESQTTTNPVLVEILCKMLVDFGCEVVVGDSSGGLYNAMHLNSVYKTCKMTDVAKISGAKLNDDFSFENVKFENGKVLKDFDVISVAKSADVIINFAKLKTHSLTYYTGCVKNMFGTIPGLQKVQVHAKFSTLKTFTQCMLDISEFWKDKIVLNIIDAVYGMEGAGPSAGSPRYVGKLIGGQSAMATDLVGIRLMDADPNNFPQMVMAKDGGIFPNDLSDIVVLGEDLERSVVKGYELVGGHKQWEVDKLLPFFQRRGMSKLVAPYPYVKKTDCRGCKKCYEHCPNDAITMVDNVAKFDLDKCIRCYCCQELCPYHVIVIRKTWISKLIGKL